MVESTKSRERALRAIDGAEPDVVPVSSFGFTPQWVESLIGRRPKDFHPIFNRFESDIIEAGPDVFLISAVYM